jgi:putative membrane-bound dehydrogenase-like protein
VRAALFTAVVLALSDLPTRAQQPLLKAPDGFKVELLLAAPDIEAPTALCVASNGDVYFAEDPMDMAGPPTKNLDRIWLLKGGDPKKKVLFADKMWAVMGLELVRDKLYVVHAPYVTVFTLDAAGMPKSRKDLFTDLGPPIAGTPSFNDHIPSGIRMGMDGWLYVSIGDKGIPKMTRKEKNDGSIHVAEGQIRRSKDGNHISLEGGGVIRFRPDGSKLEVFASGTRNHLDVPLDDQDRIFVRDNTDDGLGWWTRFMYLPEGAFMGYPWAYTRRPKDVLPIIHDFGGGSPCGGWVYLDDGLPETYRGRVFHCEWGKGKVFAVKVAPEGGGFKFVDEITFLDPDGTGVKDFRPFTLRPTADGRGFYVTDWGYSGWSQKLKMGRIWKVTYVKNDVKPQPRGKDSDSVADLVKALDHPAHSERLRAQRALAVHGQEALDGLVKAFFPDGVKLSLGARQFRDDDKVTTHGSFKAAGTRHALWVLRDLGWPKWPMLALDLSRDKDDSIIYNALRVMGGVDRDDRALPDDTADVFAGELISIIDGDEHAPNRMQAVLALRAVATTKWCKDIFYEMGLEKDLWVRFAAVRTLQRACDWKAVAPALPPFPRWSASQREIFFAAAAEQYDPGAVEILAHLTKQSDAAVRQRALEVLTRVHHDRKPYAGGWWGTQPAARKPPARVVAWEGTPIVRAALLQGLGDSDAEVRRTAVAGLVDMNDPSTFEPLSKRLSEEKDAAMRLDIVRVIAGLQTKPAADLLVSLLNDGSNTEALRLEAISGLQKLGTAAAAETIGQSARRGPVALQVRALEALGEMKTADAKSICEAALGNSDAAVRHAAVAALGNVGDPAAAAQLTPLLKDNHVTVAAAAAYALGKLRAKEAIPALVHAASEEALQFEATLALTAMPDARALSSYLTGLTSKNLDLRKACRLAVTAIRDQAAPMLEQLAKRNEIRAEALAELREIYSAFSPILRWNLIGPFPRDGKAHPPEQEQRFDAAYPGAEQEVRWQPGDADAKQYGRVNLFARFNPNQQVEAYGFAEIESTAARDATLQVGSDDTITIWLNGVKVHEHLDDRGWAHDQDRVHVKLHAGKNRLLVKCSNSGGPWDFSVAVTAEVDRYDFLKGAAQKFDLGAFRSFAAKNAGNAERGAKLFLDTKGLACVKCHAVAGQGGHVGPDLAGIALRYQRDDLVTSILEPSKAIAQGYETVVVTTTKGVTLTGVFKGESGESVNLMDAEGKAHRIAKKDIEERAFSPVSTMPNGLSDGMTPQDFADIVAFLEARREEKVPARK